MSNDASIQSAPSNVPEFSVSDLAFSLKKTLEETFGHVRVRGELSRVSIAGSGHMYSSLKDDGAVIDAVCWKGVLSKLPIKPEEGLEVIVTGRISTYPQRSNYQLIIESMELAGEGALLKMLEERRKKLAAEGLFAAEKKKPLPFLPRTIGVVTSPTGAVIRDILHRLHDRFPVHVLLWPVLVQGENAAAQITDAINGFQTIHERGLPKPDLLIVARGGGSLEDLMPFNEENVVRAVAASTIPVISAVGHETDTTLCDYAADLRAPTPTGAAEMAVRVRAELQAQILDNQSRLLSTTGRILNENRHKLEARAAKLGSPQHLLETKTQRLDHAGEKLSGSYTTFLSIKKTQLIERTARLPHPQNTLKNAQKQLERWSDPLKDLGPKMTRDFRVKLNHAASMLEAYSYENTLKRGFTVIKDEKGHIISDASQTRNGQPIVIQFREKQEKTALITNSEKTAPLKAPKTAKKPQETKQQSLF
ncbi:MAG: exodeoxyribonuclease VII large subunit [Alphaproteobacteria bacterium]|nr:exodeoxyribonuclease VII large subunit [Alphaproteobacteria bacterium]